MKTKESDNRSTPQWLMEVFKGWFDPCPLDPHPKIDGLSISWKNKTFVNPPYSNPKPWVEKAIAESKRGKIIALLMKFDPTTEYFRMLMKANAHIFYSGERMRFLNLKGEGYASPFPSVLIILNNSGYKNFI